MTSNPYPCFVEIMPVTRRISRFGWLRLRGHAYVSVFGDCRSLCRQHACFSFLFLSCDEACPNGKGRKDSRLIESLTRPARFVRLQ